MYVNPDELSLCFNCIGEPVLKKEVHQSGVAGTCMECGQHTTSITVSALADRIQPVFERHFVLSPDGPDDLESAMLRHGFGDPWYRDGDPPDYLIQDLAQIPESAAKEVVDSLSERDDSDQHSENPYGDEARYFSRTEDDASVWEKWRMLERQVHHRGRFFNSFVSAYLDELFEGVLQHKTSKSAHAVSSIAAGREIYRARVASRWTDIEGILQALPGSMGSPPGRIAKAGRMNATGIGVFYGALAFNTCIAEVRAPVGAQVIIGKFQLLRPVKVLNLRALAKRKVTKSLFDPEYTSEAEQSAFLKLMSSQFSAPVLPGDEDFDYLLPQVICEYLSEVVGLDGVLYSSSQTGGKGTNLALFPKAAVIEAFPAGMMTSLGSSFDEDQSPTLEVTTPSTDETEAVGNDIWGLRRAATQENPFWVPDLSELGDLTAPKPALKFMLDSVEVSEIKGIAYKQVREKIPQSVSVRSKNRDRHSDF